MPVSSYRTINLRPETYERLRIYQIGGRSMSDTVDDLMDAVEPDEFYREALKEHDRRLRDIRRGKGLPVAELDKALRRKKR